MKKLLLTTTLLGALTLPSLGATIDLGFDIINGQQVTQSWNTDNFTPIQLQQAVPSGNQVDNIPCIICGKNQPQQPSGFGYNLFGSTGNADTVSFFSTAIVPSGGQSSGLAIDQLGTGYSILDGSPLLAAVNGRIGFSIGIDVNDTSTPQTLESFWMLNLTTKAVLAAYSPGPGGALVPNVNNGTGFPDWTLSGFTLNGIDPGDKIIFYARITGANDGPDSFFINPNLAPVPIPAAAWLFGSGLLGLGLLNRRRRAANKASAT